MAIGVDVGRGHFKNLINFINFHYSDLSTKKSNF